ncbi:MAG: ribbon-helix-helix protein, CopG family [Candidatus Lokiarchaeota archaeon]|nr:ribbon-helix-helix protein, CopG family [Candidatus Lokiarchaeota archaeon]MBD3340619.1 ribbon-helix-helix protein, CopG family [Candidatus Lokiarchaeota archaeon]
MTESRLKKLDRVTFSLDEDTARLLLEMKDNLSISQSELIRNSIKFYYKYKRYMKNERKSDAKMKTYLEMLDNGEHIILDVDHYLSFLKFIENSPQKDSFWESHKEIGRSHADQFKHKINTFEDVVSRLEICNFFKIVKESSNRYTLLLGSDLPKTFIRVFLEEVLNGMGFKVDIKEDFAKLRILLKNVVL